MNNKGVTLIELIFVLLLLGIIITIALPRLDFSDRELKVYGRQLVSDLNNIKISSQTTGIGSGNEITLKGNYYNFNLYGKSSKNIHLNSRYSISSNFSKNTVRFHPNGSPYQAGTILIFNDTNNKYIEITITPGTGRIHMYDKIRQVDKSVLKNDWVNDWQK